MHRTGLLQLLDAYDPLAPEEQVYKRQIIAFVQEHPQCFERSLAIGHIVASAWLLNTDHSQALLMHHAKLNRWVQLGGHCDGETNVLDVALKEAREESGIQGISPVFSSIFDIDVHLIPTRHPCEPAHYHFDIRSLLQVTSNEQVIKNDESHELRWIDTTLQSLPDHNHSLMRMFNKWIALRSFQ